MHWGISLGKHLISNVLGLYHLSTVSAPLVLFVDLLGYALYGLEPIFLLFAGTNALLLQSAGLDGHHLTINLLLLHFLFVQLLPTR